ncbi:MAG: molybdopterin-guanine dinucleotide biosynthesis protein MobB, partial [Thermaerobacterales bacterium]
QVGQGPKAGPGRGEAWGIATGACLPHQGDVVVPWELTRSAGGNTLEVRRALPAGRNIAAPDEDVKRGERLVAAGERIRPAAIGLMVTAGIARLQVFRRPRVALLATGEEVEILSGESTTSSSPEPGRVFNSQGAALTAHLEAMGLSCTMAGVASDDPADLRQAFGKLLAAPADVILTTGGVSVGPRDLVAATWLELGATQLAGRIAMKPGGPFFAGRLADRWLFGLSGNPAAGPLNFHLLVQPVLRRLEGLQAVMPPWTAVSVMTSVEKQAEKTRIFWAAIDDTGTADPLWPAARLLVDQEQGRLTGAALADALVVMPTGTPAIESGDLFWAMRLDDSRAPCPGRCKSDRPWSHAGPGWSPPELGRFVDQRPGPPVVALAGVSGSGKTFAAEGLIHRLRAKGLQVLVIKHAAHGFEMDQPGTDSARLTAAGAAGVWLDGRGGTAALVIDSDDGATGSQKDGAKFSSGEKPWNRALKAAMAAYRVQWGRRPDLVLIEGFAAAPFDRVLIGKPKEGTWLGRVLANLPDSFSPGDLDVVAESLLKLIDRNRQV